MWHINALNKILPQYLNAEYVNVTTRPNEESKVRNKLHTLHTTGQRHRISGKPSTCRMGFTPHENTEGTNTTQCVTKP